MIRGLYIAASGMIARQIQQENLSNNIANINTAGFKQDKVSFKTFNEVLIQNYDKKVGSKNFRNIVGETSLGVGINEIKTDKSQGMIEETGRKLDFAIEGEGYFVVRGADGKEYYTRNGRFKVDSEGYLSTMDNKRIIGVDNRGVEGYIRVNGEGIEMDTNGNIVTDSGVYRFRIVNGEMEKLSDNNYISNNVVEVKGYKVGQYKIEKSNVDMVSTITELISIARNFEANQKVLQSMDQILGKAVNEIGNINR